MQLQGSGATLCSSPVSACLPRCGHAFSEGPWDPTVTLSCHHLPTANLSTSKHHASRPPNAKNPNS